MIGRVGGERDQHKSLRRNANGEGPVFECEVLWRGRFAGGAKLHDLIAGGEGGTAHCVVCFDDVAVVGVETPDLNRRAWGDTFYGHGKCL